MRVVQAEDDTSTVEKQVGVGGGRRHIVPGRRGTSLPLYLSSQTLVNEQPQHGQQKRGTGPLPPHVVCLLRRALNWKSTIQILSYWKPCKSTDVRSLVLFFCLFFGGFGGAAPCGLWNIASLTRDQTCIPRSESTES